MSFEISYSGKPRVQPGAVLRILPRSVMSTGAAVTGTVDAIEVEVERLEERRALIPLVVASCRIIAPRWLHGVKFNASAQDEGAMVKNIERAALDIYGRAPKKTVDSIASLGSLERARAKMNENSASGEPTAEERADWEELKRAWFEPSAGVGINTTGAWISSGAAAANSMIAGRDAIIAEMRRSGGAVARKEDAFEAELRRFHMEREEQLALREKKKLAADVKARDAHASAVVNRNLLLLL